MSSNKKSRKKSVKGKERNIRGNLYPALTNTNRGQFYGYIDENGKLIIEAKFTNANDFNEYGLAIVQEAGKYGLINIKGDYVVTPTYDSINKFCEMRAIFTKDDMMGVIDERGVVITKKKYNFIGDYKEDRAIFAISLNKEDYRYGYINLDGEEVISPRYLMADDFNDGTAVVKVNDKMYSLINKDGVVLNNYNYEYLNQYGNGLMVFSNSSDGPYGFINKDGVEIIKPIYEEAQGFRNGMAVVSEKNSVNGSYGVIGLNGEYIYPPIFGDVKILGEDRVALGMAIGSDEYVKRNIYAIGDIKGRCLTNFEYFGVGEYENELAYAFNNEYEFFIDMQGNKVKNLPTVKGSGELSIKGNLIYAYVDYLPYYLGKNGEIIYKPNDIINLDKNYSVIKEKDKPNINYLIYKASVKGIKNKNLQDNINSKLSDMFYFKPYGEHNKSKIVVVDKYDILDYDYYSTFNVKYFSKNLLILDIESYCYYLGAAHGMPTMKTPNIDLVTGKFYTIKDLFMGSVYWVGELNKIIKKMMDFNPEYKNIFKSQFESISFTQDFYIDDDNLYIYFQPYEIALYSSGFVTFKIPFSQIYGMINVNGDYYKSFKL